VTFSKSIVLTVCALAFGFSAPSAKAAEAAKSAFTDEQRAALEDYVRNFILDNPEVLMESVNRYRTAEDKKKEEGAVKVLKDGMGYINNGTHPTIGNPKGDITVVEFFDYNCGYCKRAMQTIRKLVENDKNVRVVFMDYPILSPQSTEASKWAIAAHKQGKYWEFHQAMLESNAPKDEANMSKIAQSVGLDVAKLKKDAGGKEVDSYLAGVTDFGHKLDVSGTPAFIVGSQILRGFVEYEGFKTIVDGERAKAE
jgi:protein-disulfide isomerase